MRRFELSICVLSVCIMLSSCTPERSATDLNATSSVQENSFAENHSSMISEFENSAQSLDSASGSELEERVLEAIDLTNIARNEIYPNAKTGDTIGSMTITNVMLRQDKPYGEWEDKNVMISFSGEEVVEIYCIYSDINDGLTSPMYLLPETSKELPALSGTWPLLKTINISDVALRVSSYIESNNIKYDQENQPLFYCKVKIDNMSITALRDSMCVRDAECVEIIEFRFEGLISSEKASELYQEYA